MSLSPGALLRRAVPFPETEIPPGRVVSLPGRGTTYVTDVPGPTPDAPTVVLLHAFATTGMLCWFPSVAALSEHFRVVVFDQRWHGQGFKEGEFTLQDCAHDVAAIVTELELGPVVLAGFSMGSFVAQRVWRQHPGVVAGLVLGATAERMANTAPERVFHTSMRVTMSALRTLNRSRIARSAGRGAAAALSLEPDEVHRWALREFRSVSPWALGPALAAIGRHHSAPWLATVDVPTAVVVTTRDRVISRARQEHVAELVPGATVHLVDGGHASVVLQAEAFVPVLVEACLETARNAGRIGKDD
ncbi:MAG TPA: alpha/beta hydrolase [Nocardioidaceae bacterium]|nr:alpha/beta hydrolase [Nocardioidaceae bacterium]